jgi:hypothetical protein
MYQIKCLTSTLQTQPYLNKKQNELFDIESVILQTTIAFSQSQYLPLNVTAYKKDAFIDLNLTRPETTTNGMTLNSTVRQRECNNCFKHDV